jgi:hypothetical protein
MHMPSPATPNVASAPLFMSYEEHAALQQNIVETAANLKLTDTPETFTQEVNDVPLRGQVPYSMQRLFGNNFTHLIFESKSTSAPDDAQMAVALASPQTRRAIRVISDQTPVEFGANKTFSVYRAYDQERMGSLSFVDFAYMLDTVIPTVDTGEFSKLSEARFALDFKTIVNRIGDSLAEKSRKKRTEASYIGRSLVAGAAQGFEGDLHEVVNQLTVKEEASKTTYGLTIFESLPVGGVYNVTELPSFDDNPDDARLSEFVRPGTILECVRYNFERNPNRRRGRNSRTRPLDATATISLLSSDFERPTLKKFAGQAQESMDGAFVTMNALKAIIENRPEPNIL